MPGMFSPRSRVPQQRGAAVSNGEPPLFIRPVINPFVHPLRHDDLPTVGQGV
jgi:hypothetical protein